MMVRLRVEEAENDLEGWGWKIVEDVLKTTVLSIALRIHVLE